MTQTKITAQSAQKNVENYQIQQQKKIEEQLLLHNNKIDKQIQEIQGKINKESKNGKTNVTVPVFVRGQIPITKMLLGLINFVVTVAVIAYFENKWTGHFHISLIISAIIAFLLIIFAMTQCLTFSEWQFVMEYFKQQGFSIEYKQSEKTPFELSIFISWKNST